MNSGEVIKILKKDGWIQKAQKGNHKQFIHPVKKGKVTVADHKGKELAAGTLHSIFRQAGLK